MAIHVAEEIILPGLTDLHVHPRDFAQSYKEDFATCTQAALAGGVTTIGAMPNYEPEFETRPYNLPNMLALQQRVRERGAFTDVGLWAAAQPQHDNVGQLEAVLPHAIGTKFYIEPTQGNDSLQDVRAFLPAAQRIHELNPRKVIAAHVEDDSIDEAIGLFAGDLGQPLLIPHVNTRVMLDAIIKAKSKDLPVFAEACPHHLFMTQEDVNRLGWYARMKPALASQEDQDYLWANINVIDTIGTDHAPHTKAEKDEANRLNPEGKIGPDDIKSYGVPGLDAILPLLLHEVIYGYTGLPRLTFDQLVRKTHTNPRKLIGLSTSDPAAVKIQSESYEFSESDIRSKAGWSPYIGRLVSGRVTQVRLRGETVYRSRRVSRQGVASHDETYSDPRGHEVSST